MRSAAAKFLLIFTMAWLPTLLMAAPGHHREGGHQQSEDYVEGIEYQRIVPEQPTTAPKGKIEVVEVFWYGCPHCYRLEPTLNAWLKRKPANVVFVRIPAAFNPLWSLHAQAYITARLMGVAERNHQAFFDAIHKLNKPMNTPARIADFYASRGVDRKRFLSVFESFAVKAKLAHYRRLVNAYGVDSVPTIIVNGKYRTNATMAGGTHEALIKVLDHLVALETAAKTGKKMSKKTAR